MKYLIGVICFIWAASAVAAFTFTPHTHAPTVTTSQVVNHSGRTDSMGCHNERATGGWHCH